MYSNSRFVFITSSGQFMYFFWVRSGVLGVGAYRIVSVDSD